jgi:hypothetical protein
MERKLLITAHSLAILLGHEACDVYRIRRTDRDVPYLRQDGGAAAGPPLLERGGGDQDGSR